MKTEETKLKVTLYVHATPNSLYGRIEGQKPYDFNVYTFERHYDENAIMVHSLETSITVPAGINLTAAAVQTLEEKKQKLKEDYFVAKSIIEDKISNLLALEYSPEDQE